MNYKKLLRNLSLVLVLILLVGCGKTDPKLKDGSGIVVSFTNEKDNIWNSYNTTNRHNAY